MKSFRFLLKTFFPNYLFILYFGTGLVGASILTGAAYGGDGPFTSLVSGYYLMFPAILQLSNLLAGMGYSTTALNTALSMGATRRGYFQGVCILQVLNAGVFWLAQYVMVLIPGQLNWSEEFLGLPVATAFAPSAPLMLLTFGWLGCALGGLYLKHRWISAIVIGLLVFFSMFSMPFQILGWVKWGDLELVICLVCVAATPLFALWSRRGMRKAVVRT